MDAWLDEVAAALGVPPMSPKRAGALLSISREVAHNVERKFAPLSTYLIGAAVAARLATGASEDEAFQSALQAVRALLPSGGRPEDQG